MRKLFLATTAIVALIAVPAGAADLRMPVKAAPVIKPACANFGGFYIGGHVGWNYYEHYYRDLDQWGGNFASISSIDSVTNTDNDWHAGVQAGYNWQSGCTVFGVQADWSWTRSEADSFHRDIPLAGADTAQLNSQLRWFGTARARTGVVIDNLLLYVTGGAAFARFDRDYTYARPGIPATAVFETDRTRLGFVVGVGTEWSFAPNWSFVSEVLYMGFEKDQQTFNCPTLAFCGAGNVGLPHRFEFTDTVWATRIGINYRWGGYPVVAKY